MVQVLETQPAPPYVKMGEITLKPSSNHTSQALKAKLQWEAARMGANAVVITSDRMHRIKGPSEISFPDQRHEGGEALVVVAEAIRFTN